MKTIKEPNVLLHTQCKQVTDFDEAKQIADKLLLKVKSVAKFWNLWLGFAANQIGYPKRIIVLRKGKNKYEVLINPSFVEERFPFLQLGKCYSINGVYLVKSHLWSKVRYQDLNGDWSEKIIRGPSAIYHEIDHINGILISENGFRIL